jgi:hypothetical protein
MLDLMLGNSPDAFSCGELGCFYRPVKSHHFSPNCVCATNPCPIWSRLVDVSPKRAHATLARELGVRFVIDSTKELSWLVDTYGWARRAGLSIRTVLIWKDPVDLAFSYWKRGHSLGFWRSYFVNYHTRLLSLGIPFVSTNYGQLVSTPGPTLERICGSVGMDYLPGRERFWEKPQHELVGSLGVRRQVQAGSSSIQAEGYPADFAAHVPELHEQIRADQSVQDVIRRLLEVEAGRLADWDRPVRALPLRKCRAWYVKARAEKLYRRRFPLERDSLGLPTL